MSPQLRRNTSIEMYDRIDTRQAILSTYSLNFENQRLLFIYVNIYILVRFIFVSMSHIFIFIYCYGFYFDLIGYIEFQFLI